MKHEIYARVQGFNDEQREVRNQAYQIHVPLSFLRHLSAYG